MKYAIHQWQRIWINHETNFSYWAQITLEFHGGFGYHTEISKFQLNNPENIEKCSRTNREIEILLFREDIGVVDKNG